MKRLLTGAVFALLACAGLATPTFAGSFGLFTCGRHCDRGAVCIRPYNAFTPVICGDVCGIGQGGCGQGGCGQGAYGPIGYCNGYGGNCGYGCGQGGCGAGGCGYGWGHQGGYDYRFGMMNLRGQVNPGNPTGLGYDPTDGYGNGAFGNYGTGRLHVFGNPSCGGCVSCKKNNWTANMGNSAPMTCGPQGCAPAYGYGMDFAAPTFEASGPLPAAPSPLATPTEVKPPLIQVPNKPQAIEPPQARWIQGYQAQPVSYLPAQQMPYGYGQPAWGYYGYQAPNYPAWGYRGW